MGSRHRPRRQLKAEINIIPFLDVLLVLLLIFMATTPAINQSVQVSLPETVKAEKITNDINPPVILEVSFNQSYRLSIGNTHHNNLNAEEVINLAKAEITRNPKALFLVGGEKTIAYEEVMNALNLLHQAGIQSVGLMTNLKMN